MHREDVGGRDLTEYLMKLLDEKGHSFWTKHGKMGFVALNGTHSQKESDYELPDGQMVHVRHQRFLCTEPLFKPSLINKDSECFVVLSVFKVKLKALVIVLNIIIFVLSGSH